MKINGHNLPDKVNILGTEYKIIYELKNDNPKMQGSKGYAELLAKELHIEKSMFATELADDPHPELIYKDFYKEGLKVIRHEIIHAFIYESGLAECCEWAENEELVDWLARQFPKMAECFENAGCIK